MRKGQLHELLAVEGGLKGEKEKIREETINTFSKKTHLFLGSYKKLHMFDQDRINEEIEETVDLTTTVQDKLNYMSKYYQRFFDVRYQKETGNQKAVADVVVNGNVLFKDVPVTLLLSMEQELEQLRKVYDAIPTLQPGQEWKISPEKGQGVYKTSCDDKMKTEQTIQHKVVYEATDKHPAQIERWQEQKPVGRYKEEILSGMVTPSHKSQLLERVSELTRAFKKARQRANCQEIESLTMGKKLFDFIHLEQSNT